MASITMVERASVGDLKPNWTSAHPPRDWLDVRKAQGASSFGGHADRRARRPAGTQTKEVWVPYGE